MTSIVIKTFNFWTFWLKTLLYKVKLICVDGEYLKLRVRFSFMWEVLAIADILTVNQVKTPPSTFHVTLHFPNTWKYQMWVLLWHLTDRHALLNPSKQLQSQYQRTLTHSRTKSSRVYSALNDTTTSANT